jgi:outer membrane protein
LFATALRQRPELAARRLEVEAAQRLVAAEGKLTKPTVSGFGTAGVVPAHVVAYEKDFYAAAGLSVNLNFFNGGLFAARRTEAALRARAAEQRLKELENRLAREVAVAYLNAQTAFERLSLTDQLLKRAALSLELAQARYDLGLSSIVELSQAQLSKTTAELQQASARYDYAAQTAALSFQLGTDFN